MKNGTRKQELAEKYKKTAELNPGESDISLAFQAGWDQAVAALQKQSDGSPVDASMALLGDVESTMMRLRLKEMEEKEAALKKDISIYQEIINSAGKYLNQLTAEKKQLVQEIESLKAHKIPPEVLMALREKGELQSQILKAAESLDSIHESLEDSLLLDENLAEDWMKIKEAADLARKAALEIKSKVKGAN